MALFFLISGFFSAKAAEKRSKAVFLKDRAKRLGVPCVVYSFIGTGLVEGIIVLVQDGAAFRDVLERSWTKVLGVRSARGPVWYCAVLFVFDVVFALTFYPETSKNDPKKPQERDSAGNAEPRPHISHLRDAQILTGVLGAAITSFALRTRYPIGTSSTPLNVELGFLPQYLLYYATGIYAHLILRCDSLHQLVPRRSIRLRRDAVHIIQSFLSLGIYAFLFFALTFWGSPPSPLGGLNVLAACYALLNETLGFLICIAVLRAFSEQSWTGREWKVGGVGLGRWRYAAFLVHAPVVVGVQCALDTWNVNGITKSFVVGGLGCVGSWGIGEVMGRCLESVGLGGFV